MSSFKERESQLKAIKENQLVKKTIKSILELYSLELRFFPKYDTLYEVVEIAIFNEKEINFADRLESAQRLKISYENLLELFKTNELPNYLYNLAIQQIIEKPSDTASKIMKLLNKKQS